MYKTYDTYGILITLPSKYLGGPIWRVSLLKNLVLAYMY